MKELELLQSKIELLLQKSTLLKEENKRLTVTLEAREQELAQMKEQEQQLHADLQTANVEREDTQQLRTQVDAAIGELDKILSLIDGE